MIYFILPAYNEEKDLPRLFEEFLAVSFPFDYRILVVNDGSTDATGEVIARFRGRLPVEVLSHPDNRGMGKAYATGFAAAARRLGEGDAVITMDADGTQPLETAAGIVKKIGEGRDVVVASRFAEGGEEQGVGFFRRLLSHTASAGLRLLWPIGNIRDYSSGYRGYSSRILRRLRDVYGDRMIEESGFSAAPELLLKASLLTEGFDEVPLRLRYDRKLGASKIAVLSTILRYFSLLSRLWRQKRNAAGSARPGK